VTFLLLAALAAVANPVLADDAKPSPAGTPICWGGVVAPDAKTVFVPAADPKTLSRFAAGGWVEARDLATGKKLWENKDAERAAAASDKLVVAWVGDAKKANAFRVVVIDAATGKTVTKSDPITMPDWAETWTGSGNKFLPEARIDGDTVTVAWWTSSQPILGPANNLPAKVAEGIVTVDVKTGKVTVLDRKKKEGEFKPAARKAGDYEFQVDTSGTLLTTAMLTVLKDKKELWKRELAGFALFPPPP
jgi:hypothetical protein